MKTPNHVTFELPEVASVGNVEKSLNAFLVENEPEVPIIIDLQDVVFIQLTTMVLLIQLIYSRDLKGYKTVLATPVDRNVRIILFTWRFYEVIEELTGKGIESFLQTGVKTAGRHRFAVDGQSYYVDISGDYFDSYYQETQLQKLVKKGFFSLICEPFMDKGEKYNSLSKHTRKWSTERLISDVLEKNLLKKENKSIGNLLANTIIFECLTNAANHPHSDHLVIGSFYDFNAPDKTIKGLSYFTVLLWDNGDSIIKTLWDSIIRDLPILAEGSQHIAKESGLRSWFRIVDLDHLMSEEVRYMFGDEIPTKESTKEEILISSLFPGITRMPNQGAASELKSVKNGSGSGLGLALLIKAVTNDLEGSIHIRTSNYLMEITKARRGGSVVTNDALLYKQVSGAIGKEADILCKCAIRTYTENGQPFLGNMITIKIPVSN